jgi:hydrogenase maturation factor
MPELGKPSPKFMQDTIFGRLGAHRSELLHGPKLGVDNAIIRVGEGRVAVCTTDPISLIPSLGPHDSAWLSVNLLASDVTTSGFHPGFAVFDLNLPPKLEDSQLEAFWTGIHKACEELGVAIAGGHTGRFVGCDYTIMGGGFMLAFGSEDKYLTSNMAQPGDVLLLTKGAAIVTTGILAHSFPNKIEERFGGKFLRKAQSYLHRSSTVNDALTAVSAGVREEGVTAMHDVTEGGVLGGIYELVSASRKGARIEKTAIPVAEETREICNLFDINPLNALGEGSLVISVRPEKSERVQSSLAKAGIECFRVGELSEPQDGIVMLEGPSELSIRYPERDTYWDAYWRAVEKGWS